jgi:hypothetical protein
MMVAMGIAIGSNAMSLKVQSRRYAREIAASANPRVLVLVDLLEKKPKEPRTTFVIGPYETGRQTILRAKAVA